MDATKSPAAHYMRPPRTYPFVRYKDRIDLARKDAANGLGFEDLVAKHKILERDAYRIVFGK